MVNRNQGDKPGLTNQDLQEILLVKDYREIILSQDVLEKVATRFETRTPLSKRSLKVNQGNCSSG